MNAIAATYTERLDFALRLRERLRSAGVSQSELARRASFTRQLISSWARGRAIPTPANLATLAAALDVAAEDLLPAALTIDGPSLSMTNEAPAGFVRLRIDAYVRPDVGANIIAAIHQTSKETTHEDAA